MAAPVPNLNDADMVSHRRGSLATKLSVVSMQRDLVALPLGVFMGLEARRMYDNAMRCALLSSQHRTLTRQNVSYGIY